MGTALAAGQHLTHLCVAMSIYYATTPLEWTMLLARTPHLRELAIAGDGFEKLVGALEPDESGGVAAPALRVLVASLSRAGSGIHGTVVWRKGGRRNLVDHRDGS